MRDHTRTNITGEIISQSKNAYLFELLYADTRIWLPKSECDPVEDDKMRVPMWLLDKEGIDLNDRR